MMCAFSLCNCGNKTRICGPLCASRTISLNSLDGSLSQELGNFLTHMCWSLPAKIVTKQISGLLSLCNFLLITFPILHTVVVFVSSFLCSIFSTLYSCTSTWEMWPGNFKAVKLGITQESLPFPAWSQCLQYKSFIYFVFSSLFQVRGCMQWLIHPSCSEVGSLSISPLFSAMCLA